MTMEIAGISLMAVTSALIEKNAVPGEFEMLGHVVSKVTGLGFNKQGDNGTGYANIIKEPSEIVLGVIYLCCPKEIKELDRCEGVSGGHYQHHTVEVITEDDERISALTCVAGVDGIDEKVKPSAKYLNFIIDGAKYHGLPTEYNQKLEQIANGSDR